MRTKKGGAASGGLRLSGGERVTWMQNIARGDGGGGGGGGGACIEAGLGTTSSEDKEIQWRNPARKSGGGLADGRTDGTTGIIEEAKEGRRRQTGIGSIRSHYTHAHTCWSTAGYPERRLGVYNTWAQQGEFFLPHS